MFTFGATNSKIKVAPPKIRKEKTSAPKKPEPLPSRQKLESRSVSRDSLRTSSSKPTARASPYPTPETPDRLAPSKRKAVRQISPGALFGDSSDSEEETSDSPAPKEFAEKRIRQDVVRKLRSRRGFSDEDGGVFKMVHAADLTYAEKKGSLPTSDPVIVELKYPSASQRERYSLIFGKDRINPIDEIHTIASIVSRVYLTSEQRAAFTDPETGFVRQIERAGNVLGRDHLNHELLESYKQVVAAYNEALETLIKSSNGIAKNLDEIHYLPTDLVHCLLQQVYDRAVAPRVDYLKNKTESKDNTYGELERHFVSKIIEKTGLHSEHVFVDLGSGCGNVVLQAALEAGCESWGCEMMTNSADAAEAQKKEFTARCRLWGIQPGPVHLLHADFRDNSHVLKAIKRADVIVVNNEVFGPDLNESLKLMFLDVKDGCKIVSLKSFKSANNKSRNENDTFGSFHAEKEVYGSGDVSWKGQGGDYFIATKDIKGSNRRRHG